MRWAAAVGCALLCAAGAARADGGDEGGGTFRRRVTTADGVALALYRYRPPGGGVTKRPVLLVPDLGMNRLVFALGGRGLAPWLRAQGRDVYLLEPRGHGASASPKGWRLWELVHRDLPAALEAISKEREGKVDLVVHGYAGALVLCSTAVELKGRVGRVVALATPMDAFVPNPYALALLEDGGRLTDLALDPEGTAILELLFARHGKIPGATLRDLFTRGLEDLGPAASGDLLSWWRAGDLAFPDGTTVKGRLAAYDRPTLQLLALRDNWVHPEAGSTFREHATRAEITVRLLSVLQLQEEDYTHLSLLHGEGAPEDVFEQALEFLDRVPSPVPEVAHEGAP